MIAEATNGGGRRGVPWRALGWGGAAALLALPLAAMQLTEEVNWDGADFLFAGILIGGVGLALELAVRRSGSLAFRGGAALALAAAFLLIWINAAVGIIGSENDPANMMYGDVLIVALAGALATAFSAAGMARAMLVTAAAHALVAAVALAGGLGAHEPPGALGILVLNAFFVGLWLAAAALFRKAARDGDAVSAA